MLNQDRAGYTLVEAAVATMLVAIVASSIFSLALTVKRGTGKGTRNFIADQANRQLAEELKNFVAVDVTSAFPLSLGPNTANTNRWSFTRAGVVRDECMGGSDCYALAAGTHALNGFLPSWFSNPPYNATIRYWVGNDPDYAGPGTMPNINITVNWSEP